MLARTRFALHRIYSRGFRMPAIVPVELESRRLIYVCAQANKPGRVRLHVFDNSR